MKTESVLRATQLALLSAGLISSTALAAPGTVSVSLSNPSPDIGQAITVTVSVSGYTDATQVDGFKIKVTYPTSLFTAVPGVTHNTADQWLKLPTQSIAGPGDLTSSSTTATAGVVILELKDTKGPAGFGTVNATGFLGRFTLTPTAAGSGSITPSLADGANFAYYGSDAARTPIVGESFIPSFSGASITVVPEPHEWSMIAAASLGGFALVRRSLKRNK